MKRVKYFCDHCAKQLSAHDDYVDLEIKLNHIDTQTDLCDGCFEMLVSVVKEFCKGRDNK